MICCLKLEYHCWYSNFKHYPIIDSGLISQQKKVYCNEVPKTKFVDGIKKTIQWYLDNQNGGRISFPVSLKTTMKKCIESVFYGKQVERKNNIFK